MGAARRRFIVLMGGVLGVVLLAAPAFATYIDVDNFNLHHTGQGQNRKLSVSGKLVVADQPPNPPEIPPGGANCPKDAKVKAQHREDGSWVTYDSTRSGNNGSFKIVTEDLTGKWRIVVPEHVTEGPNEKNCFKFKSDYKMHTHGHG